MKLAIYYCLWSSVGCFCQATRPFFFSSYCQFFLYCFCIVGFFIIWISNCFLVSFIEFIGFDICYSLAFFCFNLGLQQCNYSSICSGYFPIHLCCQQVLAGTCITTPRILFFPNHQLWSFILYVPLSLTYMFIPFVQPGSFDLVGTIIFEIDQQPYQSTFYNGTIEVVESGGFLSTESVFLVTLGIALLVLFGLWLQSQIQNLSKVLFSHDATFIFTYFLIS